MKGRDGSFFEVWGILDSLRSIWQHHRASANRVDIAHRTAPTAALTRYATLACRLPRNRREEAEKRRRRARGGACPGSAVYRWPLTLSDTEGCISRDTYGSASILLSSFDHIRSCYFSCSLSAFLLSQKGKSIEGHWCVIHPSPGVSEIYLLFLHDERKREERAVNRGRHRCRLPQRRYSQPLRASTRARLDLRKAQGQYLSKNGFFPRDRCSCSRVLGDAATAADATTAGEIGEKWVCFDRGAEKVRVSVEIASQVTWNSQARVHTRLTELIREATIRMNVYKISPNKSDMMRVAYDATYEIIILWKKNHWEICMFFSNDLNLSM